jgi:HlyD family secretion protein
MRGRSAQTLARWVLWSAVAVAVVVGVGFLVLRVLRPVLMVTEATEGPVVQAFYSTGTVEPVREYPIRSNTAGILTAVNVEKGDGVRKGQELAAVTDSALFYARDRAKAELDERLARRNEQNSPVLREFDARLQASDDILAIAQREQKRVTDMLERNAASQSDLDAAINRVKTAWSEVESLRALRAVKILELDREVEVARAALNTAQWNLDQQSLRSPIDGVVLDRPTSIGTRVAVNDQILRLADVRPESLVMRAAVDEEDIVRVRIGQLVRLTLYALPGEVLSGRVARVYNEADPNRRTFEVDVEVTPPDARLSPGMTAELAFILAAKERATVIPSQAVQNQAVWIVRDQRLVRLTPQLGLNSVERVEVLAGLAPGDRVVISPIGSLTEGQQVRTNWIDPLEAAALNTPEVEEQPFKAFD